MALHAIYTREPARNLILAHECNTWAQWLAEAKNRNVCLRDADFSFLDLEGVDFSGMDLMRTYFLGACLNSAKFVNANLDFTWMMRCTATEADFSLARLCDGTISHGFFYQANFSGALLDRTNCECCEFTGANLRGASFRSAQMLESCFCWARNAVGVFFEEQLVHYRMALWWLLSQLPGLAPQLANLLRQLRASTEIPEAVRLAEHSVDTSFQNLLPAASVWDVRVRQNEIHAALTAAPHSRDWLYAVIWDRNNGTPATMEITLDWIIAWCTHMSQIARTVSPQAAQAAAATAPKARRIHTERRRGGNVQT